MQDDARDQARAALLKFLGVAVGVAVVVGLGTLFAIKALGLGGGDPSSTPAAEPSSASSPTSLPTVALTPSGSASPSVSAEPSEEPSQEPKPKHGIRVSANPTNVTPGQRINLVGTYPGADNVSLQVQRREGGKWVQFGSGTGVSAPVSVGTFATYVITSRSGENRFRLLDPTTGKASNPVVVSIG